MALKLTIKQAEGSEAKALSELAIKTYVAAFGHTFAESDLAAHLEANLSSECFLRFLNCDVILVAEVEGELIGFVQFGPLGSGESAANDQELRRLYVLAEFQSKGVGGLLMEAALAAPQMAQADRIALDVWEHNPGRSASIDDMALR